MPLEKPALIRELAKLGIKPKTAAKATGWYPEVRGDKFTYSDPIEAIERYCLLNSCLTPAKAAKQISELVND